MSVKGGVQQAQHCNGARTQPIIHSNLQHRGRKLAELLKHLGKTVLHVFVDVRDRLQFELFVLEPAFKIDMRAKLNMTLILFYISISFQ